MTASSITLLTPAEAGKRLAVSESTVRRYIASGQLPRVDLNDHGRPRVRVRSDDLDAFIEQRTVPVADSA